MIMRNLQRHLMQFSSDLKRRVACVLALSALSMVSPVFAGVQQEEELADSVRTLLRQSISAALPVQRPFTSSAEYQAFAHWQAHIQPRLSRFVDEPVAQRQLLTIVDYEARRAGLEPALVLAVIEVESRFNPKATSSASARGLMQVMPFWTKSIGDGQIRALHDARINVRYGCVILRHYLDREQGNLVRALARYNGSLGQLHYPTKVLTALAHWRAGT